jgi:hypothetical protein
MKFLVILLIATLCLAGASFAQRQASPGLVGTVTDQNLIDGCGCYFKVRGSKRTSQKYIFAESIEEDARIWMNIDGRDVRLRIVKDWRIRDRERVGNRSTRTFAADGISVTSTYRTTRVCAKYDENCESSDYEATFVVRKGKRVQTVRAVGSCGC